MDRLSDIIDHYVSLPPKSAPRARGVRYFVPIDAIKTFWGAMNELKEGQRRRQHIIVRHAPEHNGLLQLYTYHFPTHWSAACVANRELIKLAQRQAHALEHDHSIEAIEWRIRFFHHYFHVFKGGAAPEPGLKPYSRFYQYTYVAIYRQLQSLARQAREKSQQQEDLPSLGALHDNAASAPSVSPSDVSFEPILFGRLHSFAHRRRAFNRAFHGSTVPLLE